MLPNPHLFLIHVHTVPITLSQRCWSTVLMATNRMVGRSAPSQIASAP